MTDLTGEGIADNMGIGRLYCPKCDSFRHTKCDAAEACEAHKECDDAPACEAREAEGDEQTKRLELAIAEMGNSRIGALLRGR